MSWAEALTVFETAAVIGVGACLVVGIPVAVFWVIAVIHDEWWIR